MHNSALAERQSHRLTQIGMSLFLIGLIVGILVPFFAVPRLALSAHLLAIFQGIFLVVVGLLWPKLRMTVKVSRLLFWLAIYGCFSAFTANILAGVWGAGNTMLPLAAGQAQGSPLEEGFISVLLRSAAVALITSVALILWGLQSQGDDRPKES